MTYKTNIRIGTDLLTSDRLYWAWNALHWQAELDRARECAESVQRLVRRTAAGAFDEAVRNGFVDC